MAPSVAPVVASNSSSLWKILPARKNTKTIEASNNTNVNSSYLAKSLKHKQYTSTNIFQYGKSKPIQMHIGKCKLYSLLMIE